jgi:hypothetical protein
MKHIKRAILAKGGQIVGRGIVNFIWIINAQILFVAPARKPMDAYIKSNLRARYREAHQLAPEGFNCVFFYYLSKFYLFNTKFPVQNFRKIYGNWLFHRYSGRNISAFHD